jgi:mycothione reductase
MVIGSGSGSEIADAALQGGLRVAYVDRGPLGGTCANVGCIPTKMIIFPADMIMEMREARRLGVQADLRSVDFAGIMERVRHHVEHERRHMEESLHHPPANLDYFPAEGHFVGRYTLEVAGRRIRADQVFIVAGARPTVPPIDGIEEVGYLDNASALQLQTLPRSVTIIGGGYIACEFAHFFEAMGSEVTIVGRNRYLLPDEDREVSELLATRLGERLRVVTGTEVVAVRREGDERVAVGRDVATGDVREFRAERIMLAAGRTSNADVLQVENTDVEVDDRGYIQVDEYLQTNVPKIWAFGDVIGREMFKHVANREALYAWHNSQHDHMVAPDYRAAPHAVFTWPQVASGGFTE